MSVIFVIPRSREAAGGAFFDGVLSCLKWKRPGDYWSVLPYIEAGDGEPPPPRDPEPPVFTSSSDALATALRETPKRLDCTDLWTGVWRATKQDAGLSRGKRHIIVLSNAEEGRDAGSDLIEELQGGRAPVQAIASGPNGTLQKFCHQTHILFRSGAPEEMVALVEQAYLNLLARYEISYQPPAASAPALKVRVQTTSGWAETLIAIP
jgi:hypothetical protein